MSKRIVFIDCETVDLDPGPATIWELALIVRDKGQPDRELVWHIRPDLPAGTAISAGIGGYYERCRAQALPCGSGKLIRDTEDDLGDPPLVDAGEQIAGYVAPLLSKALLVGANVGSFDAPHLDAYLRAHGHLLAADYHFIDAGSLVLGWAHGRGGDVPEAPLKLDAAIGECGLDRIAYTAHEALSDARACRDIWDAVMGGKP